MTDSPPGLELQALHRFLWPLVPDLGESLDAEVIPGGRSNLTYVVDDGRRRFVVRRPPLAHVLPTAHDMAREVRMLHALRGTDIPVPHVVAECEDASVIGAPFYVMEFIDGHVVRDQIPAAFVDSAKTRREISEALIDTMATLHALTPDSVGLGDFGRPEGFLARQVRRWWQQWEASKTRELPAIEELHLRLEATLPEQSPVGIVHGDYRLDNVMFGPRDPSRIVAVLDWEMATIGDPLCDLGLLLVYWADNAEDAAARTLHGRAITVEDGFLRRDAMLARYAASTSRDLSALDWYVALGAYKLAIIAEGIHARFLMGMTVGDGFEGIGHMVPPIVEGALDTLQHLAAT